MVTMVSWNVILIETKGLLHLWTTLFLTVQHRAGRHTGPASHLLAVHGSSWGKMGTFRGHHGIIKDIESTVIGRNESLLDSNKGCRSICKENSKEQPKILTSIPKK